MSRQRPHARVMPPPRGSVSTSTGHSRTSPEYFSIRGTDLRLRLRIQPRASRAGIEGVREGRLRVRVSATPVDGAANEDLITLLADALGVPRSALTLTRGEKSRDKEISVRAAAARATELLARIATVAK